MLCCTGVVAQDKPVDKPVVKAEITIDGETEASVGDLVVLSVEQSKATSFKWIMIPESDNFLVIDDGKRAVFSSGVGGQFQFVVACALNDTCDVIVHTLVIDGEPVTPVDSLTRRLKGYCDQIDSATKKDDCLKLAQSFSSIALIADQGKLTTIEEIIEATFNSNQDALGSSLDDWLPFRNGLATELKTLAENGQLPDVQAHIDMWKKISSTLKEYASTI